MVFHWNLSDNKSPQISRSLLSILSYLNDAAVSMVMILLLISNSFSFSFKLFETVICVPVIISITSQWFLVRSKHLYFRFLLFLFSDRPEPKNPLGIKFCNYFSLSRIFCANVSRWFLTGIWVTANLFKSPKLFSVLWPISIMLWFGLSSLFFLFTSPPFLVPILWWFTKSTNYNWYHRHFHVP